MTFLKAALAALGFLFVFASDGYAMGRATATELAFETLYGSARCDSSVKDPAVTLVTDETTYRLLYRRLPGGILSPVRGPEVDFKKDAVLFVEMGRRPTAGYEVVVKPGFVIAVGDVIELRSDFRSPPPGMITAQVVTSPCVILKLERGSYKKIKLLDLSGKLVAETTFSK